jgi:Flp pilus assembly protein TadG
MNGLQKLFREEKGSQLLEFILTFPLVWILIVFAFDQFTILYNKQRVLAAAYEAGRIAAVQPNYGLAQYHGYKQGTKELEQGISVSDYDVQIIPTGTWKKGRHFKSQATVNFRLIASGERYELTESYQMMIENAEDK